MKIFHLEAAATVPVTMPVTVAAETSEAACEKLKKRLSDEMFTWTTPGGRFIELDASELLEVTDVVSVTRDDEARESQSSGMFCATFDLVLAPTGGHQDNSFKGFAQRLDEIMEGARMEHDPSSPILGWEHMIDGDGLVAGKDPGEARAKVGLYAYGASPWDAMTVLHKALLRAIASADDELISSVARKDVREVPLDQAQRMQADGEAARKGHASPRRRPRM